MKYRVIQATRKEFEGIEIPLDFSNSNIGDNFNFLGTNFVITQIGKVVTLSSQNEVVVLFQVESDSEE